jgi:hypothetical protein
LAGSDVTNIRPRPTHSARDASEARPAAATITVLVLEGNAYAEHGVFQRGDDASSRLLAGFEVSVDQVFDAK